ncbi:CDP-alcohol phosphatidyltransferase family [Clostridium botulinum C str. Eklund]|nr:CDP-alcohol phosphatidyltransferase family [Clostridium botulinum C str. Eklund]NEZ48438.1 CDP-alcohol phosphatidyltransferase family protein [Clostridium botulinum]
MNKKYHFAEFFYNKYITGPLLPLIAKTSITPNMITSINLIMSFFTFYFAYEQKFKVVAIMMLFYEFCDNLDGNLARYKNLSSKFGAKLDQVSDIIFYNLVFVFLGIKVVDIKLIMLVIFLINFYGIIATYYIGPRLRKLKVIKRSGLKRIFFDKGIILGMDVGTIDVICSIFLFLNYIRGMYITLIMLLFVDIFYRIIELKYNQKINANIINEEVL